MIDDDAIKEQLKHSYEWDNFYNDLIVMRPPRKKSEDDITNRQGYDMRDDDIVEEDEDAT